MSSVEDEARSGRPVTRVADLIELTELFDVDVDDLARGGEFVATDRLGRLKSRKPIEPQPFEDTGDRGRRDADFRGDLLACVALPTENFDPGA